MRILGVDPALTITGYGVIDFDPGQADNKNFSRSRLALLEAGIVKTSCRQVLTMRLGKIHQAITELICETKPDAVVVEKLYVHHRHPTTAYLLGQARGVICLACAKENIPLIEYAATRVKKAVVGNGLASKNQVQRMVASILNLTKLPKYNDVTDALALAIAHSYIVRVRI